MQYHSLDYKGPVKDSFFSFIDSNRDLEDEFQDAFSHLDVLPPFLVHCLSEVFQACLEYLY